jgi:hypothetical protein
MDPTAAYVGSIGAKPATNRVGLGDLLVTASMPIISTTLGNSHVHKNTKLRDEKFDFCRTLLSTLFRAYK